MKIIGVTGGVGSGKSQVLAYLEEAYKATICQLDEVAKMLQQKGGVCYPQIVEVFGSIILQEDGELDRGKLAQLVFSDAEKLQQLNQIVHPQVEAWVLEDIEKKKALGVPVYVIEAALMPESDYEEICDEMWYIYTEEQVRRERLKQSRGYTDEKITNMIQSQPSEEAFRRCATVVIENSGTMEATKKQIGERLR